LCNREKSILLILKETGLQRSNVNNKFLSEWAAMEMQKVRIGMDGGKYPVSMLLRLMRTTLKANLTG
jgi:hypothetical protein